MFLKILFKSIKVIIRQNLGFSCHGSNPTARKLKFLLKITFRKLENWHILMKKNPAGLITRATEFKFIENKEFRFKSRSL